MVHFGKRLLSLQYEPWKEHYVDYNQLKRLLEQPQQQQQQQDNDDSFKTPQTPTTTKEEEEEATFREKLDSDIEDAVLFCLQQQGKLAERLRELKQERIQCRKDMQFTRTGNNIIHTNNTKNTSNTNNSQAVVSATTTITTTTTTSTTITHLMRSYRAAAEILVQLLRFTELNLTAVRKILKKHDRIVALQQQKQKQYQKQNQKQHPKWTLEYFTRQQDGSCSSPQEMHLQQLLHDPSVDAMVATLRHAFAELQHMEQQQLQQQTLPSASFLPYPQPHHHQQQNQNQKQQTRANPPRRNQTAPDLFLAADKPSSLLEESSSPYIPIHDQNTPSRFVRGNTSDTNLAVLSSGKLHHHYHHHYHDDDDDETCRHRRLLRLEPVLLRIEAARSRLHESSQYIKLLAATSRFQLDTRGQGPRHDTQGWDEYDDNDPEQQQQQNDNDMVLLMLSSSPPPHARISKLLNLLSTFLYMVNYYIAAPTSGAYAAKLHGSPALAGLVIGMTPTAALAGTLLYSYWTSYSYKVRIRG
eukprot:scaffold25842_cov198-Amphora_coffeaeformis.AAC.43